MRDDWPAWARSAWASIDETRQRTARLVWETLAEGFDGVVVTPAPLVHHLVGEGRLGHRSTLETVGLLVVKGLVHARTADGATILWVPEPLMPTIDAPDRPEGLRPRFARSARSNGSSSPRSPAPAA